MTQPLNQPTVTIFSTPTCPWCRVAKEYLTSKAVQFTDIDVSQDYPAAMRMVQKSGQMGVPQLWIDDEVVVGFNQARIDTLLGLTA